MDYTRLDMVLIYMIGFPSVARESIKLFMGARTMMQKIYAGVIAFTFTTLLPAAMIVTVTNTTRWYCKRPAFIPFMILCIIASFAINIPLLIKRWRGTMDIKWILIENISSITVAVILSILLLTTI